MNNFTFLSSNQIIGYSQLDILKEFGTKCNMTDFSILLGGHAYEDSNNSQNNIGYWWLSTPHFGEACVVDNTGKSFWKEAKSKDVGARPSVVYTDISSYCTKKTPISNGLLEVEYGEYPQNIVFGGDAAQLEQVYLSGKMKKTGKSYTTSSSLSGSSFREKKHIEFEYNGKKYIRVVANTNEFSSKLSNGKIFNANDVFWVKVEPIRWIVDVKANIALSKNILFSGVSFNNKFYDGFFSNSDIKKFIDEYFVKDIIPSVLLDNEMDEVNRVESSVKDNKDDVYMFDYDPVSEDDILRATVESDIPVFLHGLSSAGKSSRVKQIDPNCVILYLGSISMDRLNGKCVYDSNTGQTIDKKPPWLVKLETLCESEPDKLHILFLDELTNAFPSIQGSILNLVLDKEVNGIWPLPKNSRIVAAGNETKDSLAANQFVEVLFNRFAHIYIKTSVESWLKWASEHNIHPAIYSFIAFKKDDALRTEFNGETPNADPRKWEMASKLLYKTGRPEMLRALVGDEVTQEFIIFCNQRVITLDDVLNDNYDIQRVYGLNVSEKYATVMSLVNVDENHLEKVRNFIEMLGVEFVAIFDSMWIQNDDRRLELIAELRMGSMLGGMKL